MRSGFGAARATQRALGRRRGGDIAAFLALLAALASIPAYVVWETWSEIQAMKRAWTIAGPPCPVVAKPAPWATNHHRATRSFPYGPATFARAFGAASCVAIPEDGLWTQRSYHVCQFNNPGALTVTAAGRSTTFQPPPGRRATVTVRHGQVRCVVGGWFNL